MSIVPGSTPSFDAERRRLEMEPLFFASTFVEPLFVGFVEAGLVLRLARTPLSFFSLTDLASSPEFAGGELSFSSAKTRYKKLVDEAVSGLDEFEGIVEFALVLLRDEGGPAIDARDCC